MTNRPTLIPSQSVPDLKLKLIDGLEWDVAKSHGDNFSLLVFYRGLHCPKCKEQLLDLQDHLTALQDQGIAVTALSMDGQDRAEQARDEWGVQKLDIAWGLSEEQARQWGLHISSRRPGADKEPDAFNEPGLFLIRPDGTLYASWIQTTPFARPKLDDLISAVKFVLDKDYPPRGTKVA